MLICSRAPIRPQTPRSSTFLVPKSAATARISFDQPQGGPMHGRHRHNRTASCTATKCVRRLVCPCENLIASMRCRRGFYSMKASARPCRPRPAVDSCGRVRSGPLLRTDRVVSDADRRYNSPGQLAVWRCSQRSASWHTGFRVDAVAPGMLEASRSSLRLPRCRMGHSRAMRSMELGLRGVSVIRYFVDARGAIDLRRRRRNALHQGHHAAHRD